MPRLTNKGPSTESRHDIIPRRLVVEEYTNGVTTHTFLRAVVGLCSKLRR